MTNSTYKIPDMMDSDLKIPPNDSFSRLTYEIRNAAPELYSEYFYAGTTAINWADRMDALAAKDADIEAQVGGEVVYQVEDETLGAWYDVAKACWDNYDSHLRRAVYTTPPSAPVEECPVCTNSQQCDSCSRSEWASLEPVAPVGVEELVSRAISQGKRLQWSAVMDTLERLRGTLALAHQPAAVQRGYKNGLNAALGIIANLGIADSEAQTNGREDAYRAVEALAAQHGGLRQ